MKEHQQALALGEGSGQQGDGFRILVNLGLHLRQESVITDSRFTSGFKSPVTLANWITMGKLSILVLQFSYL